MQAFIYILAIFTGTIFFVLTICTLITDSSMFSKKGKYILRLSVLWAVLLATAHFSLFPNRILEREKNAISSVDNTLSKLLVASSIEFALKDFCCDKGMNWIQYHDPVYFLCFSKELVPIEFNEKDELISFDPSGHNFEISLRFYRDPYAIEEIAVSCHRMIVSEDKVKIISF